MKQTKRNGTGRSLLLTAAILVMAFAFAFTTACDADLTASSSEGQSVQLESIEEGSAPLAGPVQNNALAQTLAEIQADPLLSTPTVLRPAAAAQQPAAAPEQPTVTEPEVTEPEVTEPEVTEPEVTEPEVTEPEVTEPETPAVEEPSITNKAITWLWKQLETVGTTAHTYFSNRAANTSLDSAGPNWAPDVNKALEAAEIGLSADSSYGWRIWKGDESVGYNIFFTENQLAGEDKGTVLEDVSKANTKELEVAEAAGDATEAIVEGSAKVAVKKVDDAANKVKVDVSYIDGGSFVADPEPEPATASEEAPAAPEAPAQEEVVSEPVEG